MVIVLVGGSLGGTVAVVVDDPIELTVVGVEEGQTFDRIQAEQLAIEVDASGLGASAVSVKVNGAAVDIERVDGARVARPGSLLREGVNELEVRVNGRFVFDDYVLVRRFNAVLATAALAVPAQTLRPADGEKVQVRGLVDDAIALQVNGVAVAFNGGAFSTEVDPREPAVVVRAVHANGNVIERVITVVDSVAPVEYPETRAVHISSRGWADPGIRAAVLALAAAGSINAVQLDIKDESGEVGYLSAVPLATIAGSTRAHYEPRAAVEELHGLGVRVIGRIVCFLDPVVASWAWSSGRRDMVVQSADATEPLESDYGNAAFTSFASPDVQQYLIDLSVEAAQAGFDEILYDYVRRPEGDLDSFTVPGLVRPAEVEIARFVRATHVALEPFDVQLGISVFGIAASRPGQIAQDIRLLAPHVEYVSPMVYPSHWGAGEYDVADPVRQPGDIVGRSLGDFYAVLAGSDVAIVPWLQAFSTGEVDYGPAEVQAQINAAMGVGSSGFLLWNANSTYDPADLGAPP
ncbi:MAG: putative glycoside hydrolase [Ilumatobacteraceae bacterium]